MDGCALLIAGFARTAESALLVRSGWAQPIAAERAVVRQACPADRGARRRCRARTRPGGPLGPAAGAGVPHRPGRAGSRAGRCWCRCRAGATCRRWPARRTAARPAARTAPGRWSAGAPGRHAELPLVRPAGGRLALPDLPAAAGCGPMVVGSTRTAEELGRAFPGTVLGPAPATRCWPTSRPGRRWWSPPRAPSRWSPGGYGAALLLDGWALLGRPDLRAAEEALRRWANAVALVASDGTVVVGADAGLAPVQALVRWDPAGAAERELADRQELRLPADQPDGLADRHPGRRGRAAVAEPAARPAEELGSVPVPSRSPAGSAQAGADPQPAAGAPDGRGRRWPRRCTPARRSGRRASPAARSG